MNVTIKFNSAAFAAGLRRADERVASATNRALFRVGVELLARANTQKPKPPIEWGDLRGSGAVQVAGSQAAYAGSLGLAGASVGSKKKRNKSSETLAAPNEGLAKHTVRVSFNTAYAKRLHESPDWTPNAESEAREPGQIGHHWLSSKLEGGAWMRDMAAQFIKDEL